VDYAAAVDRIWSHINRTSVLCEVIAGIEALVEFGDTRPLSKIRVLLYDPESELSFCNAGSERRGKEGRLFLKLKNLYSEKILINFEIKGILIQRAEVNF
jgi:hypothetical protein